MTDTDQPSEDDPAAKSRELIEKMAAQTERNRRYLEEENKRQQERARKDAEEQNRRNQEIQELFRQTQEESTRKIQEALDDAARPRQQAEVNEQGPDPEERPASG